MFSGNQEIPASRLQAEMMRQNRALIEDFVMNADVPKWYRGLSTFQKEAASKLHFAIRDDLEQGTTHRVKALLTRIGLRPPMREENIRFVMFLSGGNDLAFLWFIKELFYTTATDSTEYNVNEQLILSCIARLDMLFTLRGLDRVLPPEQPTKYEIQRMELAKRKTEESKLQKMHRSSVSETNTVNSMRIKYKLPYFDDLVRPRLHERPLTAYPEPYRTNIELNKVLRDSTFVIPNAHNRWFAQYNLHPGKKTGMQMLTEKMSEILKAKTPGRTILELSAMFDENMYKRATHSLHELISSEHDMEKSLCRHHQILANMERNIEHEMRVRAREECLKYFNAETPEREERIARIRKQIEKDVNAHLIQFKKLADRTRSHLHLWSQDEIRNCDSEEKSNHPRSRLSGGAQSQSDSNIHQRYENTKRKLLLPLCMKSEENIARSELTIHESEFLIGDSVLAGAQQRKCCEACMGMSSPPNRNNKREHVSKIQRVREILHQMPCDCGYGYIKNYDYGHSENWQRDGELYFKSPDDHHPYIFDYQRVFALKEKETSRLNVQREYLKIINSDLNLEKIDPEAPKNLDEAIKRYAKRALTEGLAAAAIDPENEENLRKLYPYLEDVRPYYDPDDAELMQRMLKNALDFLALDKRYVLASMSDAHKLPSLLAWIESRFGKAYTRQSLHKVHDESLPTIHALKKMTVDVGGIPSPKMLGNAILVNYNCRDYLLKKSEMLRKSFYERVNASIMDQSRTFYMAMKPNLNESIKDTFFAYMPSREADIQHFRIWRSHEYMPAKEEFIKRKCRALKLAKRWH
ncbi:uncharacterized protein [Eurosta solidaginis]|uniref:uncharacterized protein n=1 Tax=Eurosta solidaginis TaxID=178769 RepID=UPI0035311A30